MPLFYTLFSRFTKYIFRTGKIAPVRLKNRPQAIERENAHKKGRQRRPFLLCVFRREKTQWAGKTLCLVVKIPHKHDRIVLFL